MMCMSQNIMTVTRATFLTNLGKALIDIIETVGSIINLLIGFIK